MSNVSRETLEPLRTYSTLIERWNKTINLVGKGDIRTLWERHILDCLQLVDLISVDAKRLIDLGSGAGLPGIVIALMRPDMTVTMTESDRRKAAFLQNAVVELKIRAEVLPYRIETLSIPPAQVVTARALAPLPKLLEYAAPLLTEDGICLFPKGRGVKAELTAAEAEWHMEAESVTSQTDPESVILRIHGIRRVAT